jgi:hypothetical protein
VAEVTEPVPDWCKPGARVGVVRHGGGRASHASTAEVRTIGKRYVVMSDGGRYTRPLLQRTSGDYSPTYTLVSREDPYLRSLMVEQRRVAQAARLERAAHEWASSPSPGTLADLRQAIAGVQPYLDRVQARLDGGT